MVRRALDSFGASSGLLGSHPSQKTASANSRDSWRPTRQGVEAPCSPSPPADSPLSLAGLPGAYLIAGCRPPTAICCPYYVILRNATRCLVDRGYVLSSIEIDDRELAWRW